MTQKEAIDLEFFIETSGLPLTVLARDCDADGDWFLLVAQGEVMYASCDERNLLRWAVGTGGQDGTGQERAH